MCYLSKHHRGLFEKIVYSRRATNKDAYIQSLTCIHKWIFNVLLLDLGIIRFNYDEKHRHFLFAYVLIDNSLNNVTHLFIHF